ncbi:DUF3489 domain-containing protein [Aurantiacibacter zhengii]|uniref:DUF3489 domain-containing protein n=1 Tax=Aurantiacibacter zhengii TaxID=2307003 RepID=A0A418NNE3_9SPHN|nr:DUF3489 domain-containing protein [Aurantiacibacter zhengii]RIV83150.1 DUF3489 domain-containing protein [Aurantiacibacter zhengii]
MTDQTEPTASILKSRQGPTKAFCVEKLLSRAKGASLAEIVETSGWQPHSARAFMTGLRKKGYELVRECRPSGETCWRIER